MRFVTDINMKADINQLELGNVIGSPSTLPGCVQLARVKNRNKKIVVVKKYNLSELSDDIDATDYIQHEVSSMKQFGHPNICQCLTSLVSCDQVWVVTPLAEYGSVADILKLDTFCSGLPELVMCLIVRDMCQALEYLHNQGVVHRAVRASHVLLSHSGATLSGFRYSTGLQV